MDGPTRVFVNMFLRSISKIDDYKMVSEIQTMKNLCKTKKKETLDTHTHTRRHETQLQMHWHRIKMTGAEGHFDIFLLFFFEQIWC